MIEDASISRPGLTPQRRPAYIGSALLLAFACGLMLRLASFRASLWLDEFSTLWAVRTGFLDMLRRVPTVMDQTPFYYSFVWASVHSLGESEFALRLPSLLFVTGAAAAIGGAAGRLSGARAAAWAFVLFWLSYPAIWAGVDARPYGLTLCCAAVAVLGFTGSCRTGLLRDRLLWIGGVSGLVWAHFVALPFCLAFGVSYAAMGTLRERYRPRVFIRDALAICAFTLPAVPQLIAIIGTVDRHQWMFATNPLALLTPLVPFSLACVIPTHRSSATAIGRALRTTLWLALFLQLGALGTASLLGVHLLDTRYAAAGIVAAAILAGDRLGQLRAADVVAPVAIYVITTVATLVAMRQVNGSFSGAGFQQWREAVNAVRLQLQQDPEALVLFRSGNAEDDLGAAGKSTWPATYAPLAGPGTTMPDWNIVLLTYRWDSDFRVRYFEEQLSPRLADQPTFFLLCQYSAEPGTNGYCGNVRRWVDQTFPHQFISTALGTFRFIAAIRFDRAPS